MSRIPFTCPKCGDDNPDIVYMVNGRGSVAAGGWPRICEHGPAEHFDVTCDRCGFRWCAEMDGTPR
jgi:hypothetical protein